MSNVDIQSKALQKYMKKYQAYINRGFAFDSTYALEGLTDNEIIELSHISKQNIWENFRLNNIFLSLKNQFVNELIKGIKSTTKIIKRDQKMAEILKNRKLDMESAKLKLRKANLTTSELNVLGLNFNK